MQVDPIKPTLKAPGTKRLKLKCDVLLSTSAFKSNSRRYNKAAIKHFEMLNTRVTHDPGILARLGKAVQVDPMNPTLKAHGTKRLKLKYDVLLSNFASKFNLRRYIWARSTPSWTTR